VAKKYRINIMKIYLIGVLIFVIFFIILCFSIKRAYQEGFGYENDPAEFREPVIYPDFITEDEAKYILQKAEYNYIDSIILGRKPDGIRKSQTYWLDKDDPVARNIIEKVCNIGGHDIEQTDDIQVVKYEPNGYYNEHHDSCCDDHEDCIEFAKDGNRIVTMIIYLTDDFEGGATNFPMINKQYKPKKYSGLMFFPMNRAGDKCHENSLHAGMPVLSGEKYIATIWIREKI